MMASGMSSTAKSSQNAKESGQAGGSGSGVDPSSSVNQSPNSDSINGAVGDGDVESSPKSKGVESPTIVKQSALKTERYTDGTSQPRLSNGTSNHDDVDEHSTSGRESLESTSVETLASVDDQEQQSQSSDRLLPTPMGSPQLKNHSHNREDSESSITAGPIEVLAVEAPESTPRLYPLESSSSLLMSTNSNRIMAKERGALLEGDPKATLRVGDLVTDDPVPMERAVAYSPGGRFLKYDIEIGRGSFKTVYKGLDTETGVAIAWCELQEKRYNKAEQARFKEEVAILKTLQHPNILKLYDSWESAGHRPEKKDKVLILVTELMTSGTLKSYMRRLKSIKPKVIRSWGRQIIRGLHFLHTRSPPIIHRDLKCDNIFINGTTGLVKIGDLGLATLKRSDVTTVIGTPEFMAPEMYEESYDESVDVYAFGMCLLEMCTQEYPYMECSNPAQIYKRVSQGIKPHAIDKIKDATLRDIIERCTIVDKAQRFNVQDLLDHEFFAENIKIEVVPVPEPAETQSSTPTSLLTMRMDVPKQDTSKKNGQESIEFPYDLREDVPEDVVREMVKSGILLSSVQHMVSRSLREYVEGVRQKRHPGRIVDEGKEKGGTEPKSNPLSHTPSPSPAVANEPTPVDELVSPKVQSQLSVDETTSSVKPDDGAVPKNETHPGGAIQGQDMTGQGAIPTGTIERDRTLSLNMSKLLEHKQSDLVSPTLSSNQPLTEHPLSTVQQITASTGQAVPQDSGLKSQSSSTLSDKKSYASVTKKTPSQNGADSHSKVNVSSTHSQLGSGSTVENHIPEATAPSQDLKPPAVRSENFLSTPSHDMQSDTSAESTPVHQSHSDTEYSSTSGQPSEKDKTVTNGTLKRKAPRGKPKPIRLTLLESNSDNKVIKCQLVTSNGKTLKYQFSLKYDKPEEMFLKFVKAGHLTDHDKDEFLQQSNQVIHSVKVKGTSASKESKINLTESNPSEPKPPNLAIQESSKPRQDPLSTLVSSPVETPPISDTQGGVKEGPESSQTSSQSDTRSSKSVHFNEGNSKPETIKPIVVSQTGLLEFQHSEPLVKTSVTSVNEQGSRISKDLSVTGSLSSSSASSLAVVDSSQPSMDNVVTHATSSQVPPTPLSPTHTPSVQSSVQIVSLPLHTVTTGGPFDNLSSCSLPQLNPQCAVPSLSTQLGHATQYGSTNNVFVTTAVPSTAVVVPQTAPGSQRVKIFEVEAVLEDQPDSPETSDMSAHGSTENLGGETSSYPQKTESQEFNPPQKSIAAPPPKNFIVNSVSYGSLESKSDSHIGKEPLSGPFTGVDTSVHSNIGVRYPSHSHGVQAPPPSVAPPPAHNQPLYQQHSDEPRTASRHQPQPYVLPQGVNQEYVYGHPANRIPEHYCTTSLLDSSYNSQRMGITEETYVHPRYTRNQSYNVLSALPGTSEPEVGDVHHHEMVHPPPSSSLDHTPTIDDLPQANLLSEAFMRFMHSMSIVFRDPTFNPLINSLDQKFGSQQAPSHFPYPSTEPMSAPPVYSGAPHEETVQRSSTVPVLPVACSNDDEELRATLVKIETEQRKLEKLKQQAIQDFHRRKHSSGNSSLESSSGLPESRKISTTSYDAVPIQSPTPTRSSVKLSEYEEGGAEGTHHSPTPWQTQRGGVSTDKFIEMEKRVKDGLTADKLRSETCSPSHAGLSTLVEQHETNKGASKTSQHVSTSTGTQTLTNTPHPSSRSTHTNLSHPEHSGSLSPCLQTSPPPQTVGVPTFQMQTSPSTSLHHSGGFGSRSQHSSQPKSQKTIRNYPSQQSTQTSFKLPHADSGEWTEYTSALPMTAAPSVLSHSHGFEGRTGTVYDPPSSGSVATSVGSRGTPPSGSVATSVGSRGTPSSGSVVTSIGSRGTPSSGSVATSVGSRGTPSSGSVATSVGSRGTPSSGSVATSIGSRGTPSSGSVATSINSRGTLSALSNSHSMTTLSSGAAVTADVSEFDPISSRSNTSVHFSIPKS